MKPVVLERFSFDMTTGVKIDTDEGWVRVSDVKNVLNVLRDTLENRKTRVNMPDGMSMANYIRSVL